MYVAQRLRVCDVCVANMGEGFEKARTAYTLLCDVCFSFFRRSSALFYYKNKFYFCLGVGAEGLGVNCPEPRLLIFLSLSQSQSPPVSACKVYTPAHQSVFRVLSLSPACRDFAGNRRIW